LGVSINPQCRTVRVQLLHVPDCPLVERVRRTLQLSLARSGVVTMIEELEGLYASPTVLIDGIDVTGRPVAPEGLASCRLDLPTEEQVSTALDGRTGRDATVPACSDGPGIDGPDQVRSNPV
jgi:hypothetical protein